MGIIALLAVIYAKLGIGPHVARVPAYHLEEVVVGIDMGVVELKIPHSEIVEFFGVGNPLRIRIQRSDRIRQRFRPVQFVRMIADQFIPGRIVQVHRHLRRFRNLRSRHLRVDGKGTVRSNIGPRFIQRLPVSPHDDPGIPLDSGDIRSQMQPTVGIDLHVDRGLLIAPIHMPQIPNAIPIGRELLHLIRIDPTVIGLVVRISRRHQLNVGTVLIGQGLAIPGMTVIHVPPGPEFAALVDMAVPGQHRSGIPAIVVTRNEIVLKVVYEYRPAHQCRKILPITDILADVVRIVAIRGIGNRPPHETVFVMEGPEFGVFRENNLIILIGVCRNVVPM